MLQPPSVCVVCHFIVLSGEYSSLIVKRMVPDMLKGHERIATEEATSLGAEHFSSTVQKVTPHPRGKGGYGGVIMVYWEKPCCTDILWVKWIMLHEKVHWWNLPHSPIQRFKIHTFWDIKYLHSTGVADVASFHGRFMRLYIIIIYLSWSWATCWPVPVSRVQKSLQRSAIIPSASWRIVLTF